MSKVPSDTACPTMRAAPVENEKAQVCVVGGGMAGVCAAIAAARGGADVLLVQDRPVLGGNASSEIRMWICGAHGRYFKESGILEEIQLLNYYRNPGMKYPIWDTVLYEAVAMEPNLRLILSCAVCEVRTEGDVIQSVRAWHLTRQRWIDIEATQFIDCSGDSVLRFSGADHRWGREDKQAFGESYGLDTPDRKTMGNSLLLQLREIDPALHRPFRPPPFARKLDDSHPRANMFGPTGHNFWWIEIGGEDDTIGDSERIRDELYAIAYGVWDFIKNHPDGRGHKWELEWIGSHPGKRENVRYFGPYTLTQQDVESQGKFPDTIAYGGWTMDDHPVAAFDHRGSETTHYGAPSPYGIPYGVLHSRNIRNLMFAGRNISTTHMAFSSTRVMATCAMVGQAAGTACAMAVARGIGPADIPAYMSELQNRLLEADQYLPGHCRVYPEATRSATLAGEGVEGDLGVLRNGHERRLPDGRNSVKIADGGHVEMTWASPVTLGRLRLVVYSNLHDVKRLPCSYPASRNDVEMPDKMPRDIRVEVRQGDRWVEAVRLSDIHKRLLLAPLEGEADGLRIIFERSWGGKESEVFTCEVGEAAYDTPPVPIEWPEPHWRGNRHLTA